MCPGGASPCLWTCPEQSPAQPQWGGPELQLPRLGEQGSGVVIFLWESRGILGCSAEVKDPQIFHQAPATPDAQTYPKILREEIFIKPRMGSDP